MSGECLGRCVGPNDEYTRRGGFSGSHARVGAGSWTGIASNPRASWGCLARALIDFFWRSRRCGTWWHRCRAWEAGGVLLNLDSRWIYNSYLVISGSDSDFMAGAMGTSLNSSLSSSLRWSLRLRRIAGPRPAQQCFGGARQVQITWQVQQFAHLDTGRSWSSISQRANTSKELQRLVEASGVER